MPSTTPRSAISCAVLAAFGGALQAQTAAPVDDGKPVQTLETVVVRASSDASAAGLKPAYPGGQVARGGRVGILGSLDVMDTPFSVTSYTQALIQNQQAQSVADVLQNDPAVRIARGFGNYQQLYVVRGFPIYSDDMSYNGLYGLLPRQYLASELLERVEVIRGANTFLNGAAPGGSGIGGAVNVMPKRAPNQPLTQVSLGVESGGQGYAAADVARRFGPDNSTGVRVNAVRRDGGTAVHDEKRELSLLSAGLDYRSGGLRLSGDIGYQDHQIRAAQPSVTIAAGLAIPAPPEASKSFAQPWTKSNERDTFGTLRGEYDLSPNLTAWAAAGMRHGKESTDLTSVTMTNPAGDTSTYRFVGSRDDKVSTGELGLRGKLQTGSLGHSLSASLAAFRFKSTSPYVFSDFGGFAGNLYTPTTVAPPVTDVFPGVSHTDIKTSSFALADTLSLMDGSVLLTLGARHQRIQDGDYDQSRVTPVAGLVVKPMAGVSLFANYIEGLVKGPTAPVNVAGSSVQIDNPGEVFAPYHAKQKEIGVKVDAGRVGGSIALFTSALPGSRIVGNRFAVVGEQQNRGGELSVYGELMPGLRLLGGATALSAKLKNTGDPLTEGKTAIGVPRTQLNIGVEWDVPGLPGLTLSGRVVQTAAQFADAQNTQRLPSWVRYDLGARYATEIVDRLVTFRARVDNAADRNYWASAGGYPNAGYLVLGAPRSFALTATVDF
jgi:iron complex outermembrane receptor protein